MNRLTTAKKFRPKELANRLTVGNFPPKMQGLMKGARSYRRYLEQATQSAKGEISDSDAHEIDLATGCECHQSICRWLLRTRLDKMTSGEILQVSRQILDAKAIRNKAVRSLGLDVRRNPWDAITVEPNDD